MTSRRSLGSSRAERAVEPTISENITLSGRRSAVVSDTSGCVLGSIGGAGEDGARTSRGPAFERNAAAYCSSPRLLSHAPTSIAVSSDLATLAADYQAGMPLLSR